ncbi:MAG: SDR family NAD(P)-dependent oxidoreductase [Polyangiaceae bacterium]|nr:SDR family NAD(P)-dependent oxidoreductase [Polyangiaceae bacterium]
MHLPSPEFHARYGSVALVAGGSEGLGAELARGLAARGLDLVLAARRPEPLRALGAELAQAHGVSVRSVAADLAEPDGVAAVVAATEGLELGLVVCNAALAPVGPFLAEPVARHERVLALNCRAPAMLIHALAPRLVARGRGGVVVCSSLAGQQGTALVAHYAATKAYLRVLAEGLWQELRPHGVDVLACCPGPVETPTFRRDEPSAAGWLSLPPMDAAAVAEETLRALGRRPVVVPGLRPALASALVTRLLPRRLAIALASAGTRAMYARRT